MLSRQQSLDSVVLGAGPKEHLLSLVLPYGTPASNLESQVLGELWLKEDPNRIARGPSSSHREGRRQPPKVKNPISTLPTCTVFIKHRHICDPCLVTACEHSPRFQGKGLGISKVNSFNGFLQAKGHCPAQGCEVTVPLHLLSCQMSSLPRYAYNWLNSNIK